MQKHKSPLEFAAAAVGDGVAAAAVEKDLWKLVNAAAPSQPPTAPRDCDPHAHLHVVAWYVAVAG